MELGPYLYPMAKKLQILEFFYFSLFLAQNFAIHCWIYMNMVPNESWEYYLSDRYKIYMLYGSEIFPAAKILPLPLKKSRKRAFFGEKFELFIISSYTMIVFVLTVPDAWHTIKLVPINGHAQSFMVKKLEKWEIFNFADFHLKMHISQFFLQTIQTVIFIAVNICSSI